MLQTQHLHNFYWQSERTQDNIGTIQLKQKYPVHVISPTGRFTNHVANNTNVRQWWPSTLTMNLAHVLARSFLICKVCVNILRLAR